MIWAIVFIILSQNQEVAGFNYQVLAKVETTGINNYKLLSASLEISKASPVAVCVF